MISISIHRYPTIPISISHNYTGDDPFHTNSSNHQVCTKQGKMYIEIMSLYVGGLNEGQITYDTSWKSKHAKVSTYTAKDNQKYLPTA